MSLLQTIEDAEKEGKALGHFNIANLEMLKAISNVARKYDLPLFIGTSEGERGYIGVNQARDLIYSFNKEYSTKDNGYHLYLNADHTYDLEKIEEAARAGYDSIIFDGGSLPFDENVAKTKKAVEIVKDIDPDILVEGELGYIGKSSTVRDEVPEGAVINEEDLPTPGEVEEFVEKTGVDLLAPAVGNMHGMFSGASNPNLSIDRIKEIRKAVDTPLVLHGGSGITRDDFKKAIEAGISIVHVSTEIRVAWRETYIETFKKKPEELAPYRITPDVIGAMEKVILEKVELFQGL